MSELRPRDPIWDALVEVFGEPSTRTNRTLRNKIVNSLREAQATGEDVILRARLWPLHFPGATLTETALEKHWDRLGRPPLRASTGQLESLSRVVDLDEVRRRMDR